MIPIPGPISVDVTHSGLMLMSGGAVIKQIAFRVNSSSAVGTATIRNAVMSVSFTTPNLQIFLPPKTPLPVTASTSVMLDIACQTLC